MKILFAIAMVIASLALTSCKSKEDRFFADAMSQCKEMGVSNGDCKCRVRYVQKAYGTAGTALIARGGIPADFVSTFQKAALTCAGSDGLQAQYGDAAAGILRAAEPAQAPATIVAASEPTTVAADVTPVAADATEVPETTQQHDQQTGNGTAFSCRTPSGKTVLVQEAGSSIQYVYRNSNGQAEMDLLVPRDRVTTEQWDGTTRTMMYKVNILNGDTTYAVYWSAARDPDAVEPVHAGVQVLVGGRQVADVQCDETTVEQRLEGIALRSAR